MHYQSILTNTAQQRMLNAAINFSEQTINQEYILQLYDK